MIIEVHDESEMKDFGERLGRLLSGGEVIELIGDVGAGKTSLTKGIARGLDIEDDVQSPSFTISRQYVGRDSIVLAHYDFYRLSDPGIMADELREIVADNKVVTVVEWSDVVKNVLPGERIRIQITAPSETTRQLEVSGVDRLKEAIQ